MNTYTTQIRLWWLTHCYGDDVYVSFSFWMSERYHLSSYVDLSQGNQTAPSCKRNADKFISSSGRKMWREHSRNVDIDATKSKRICECTRYAVYDIFSWEIVIHFTLWVFMQLTIELCRRVTIRYIEMYVNSCLWSICDVKSFLWDNFLSEDKNQLLLLTQKTVASSKYVIHDLVSELSFTQEA